jgi:uncharacterized protein (TIGR00255 family)
MLLSMTGIGESRHQDDRMTVLVEVRAVNNRHLKLTVRATEPYAALEPEIERLVRETVRRGTVQLTLRVDRPRRPEDYRLNLVALGSYRDQLETFMGPHTTPPDLAALLTLPGVVEDRRTDDTDPHEEWALLLPVVAEALFRLQAARAEEGQAMAAELLALADAISRHLERIAARGPEVVSSYQTRLTERVQSLVARHGITVEPTDLIREVAILAERADIAEEVVRLRAHLVQFAGLVSGPESAGRKLEFVVQEMGRETNTIGSKANDVAISRDVVEIKGRLESIRELIQNVE